MPHIIFRIAVGILFLLTGSFSQTQSLSMKFGGVTRTYVLHVPTGLAATPPLMFVLCGHGMTGAQQESSTQMDKIADREKFIVVYPDAISMNWDQAGTSDFLYFVALLDTIDAKYHVDKNRVYCAGFSQGAGMTHGVGCGYADKFAAIAPVSGNIPAVCAPQRPIPMFLTFGTNDIATPDKFMASVTTWANLNGCPTTPTHIKPYPANHSKSVITRIVYGPCKNGTEVIADSVVGGPHEWPMDTVTKVNNSEEVWAFFKKFSLNGSTSISRPLPSNHETSAAHANGTVHILWMGSNFKVEIFDPKGRLIETSKAKTGQLQ